MSEINSDVCQNSTIIFCKNCRSKRKTQFYQMIYIRYIYIYNIYDKRFFSLLYFSVLVFLSLFTFDESENRSRHTHLGVCKICIKKRKENIIIFKKETQKQNKYKIKTKANNNIYTETANKCDQIFYNNISLQETATTSNKKPKTKTKKISSIYCNSETNQNESEKKKIH